jgi:hypothetical protein
MRLGLDFDDTVSLDPELFGALIELFKARGHEVIIVTIRQGNNALNSDVLDFAKEHDVDVIFTEGKQKAPFCNKLGKHVDVWMDDYPAAIPSVNKLAGMAFGCLKMKDLSIESDDE